MEKSLVAEKTKGDKKRFTLLMYVLATIIKPFVSFALVPFSVVFAACPASWSMHVHELLFRFFLLLVGCVWCCVFLRAHAREMNHNGVINSTAN